MHRNTFCRGLTSGDVTDCVDERLPVMGSGTPDKRAIDIEEDQSGRQISV